MDIDYLTDDRIGADEFLHLANSIWPGDYDREKVASALTRTVNISARLNGELIGCLRILSDGYFFSTIPEAFVIPKYQGLGVGSKLFELAKQISPTSLFFGAQPDKIKFYENRGFEKSLQSFQFQKSDSNR